MRLGCKSKAWNVDKHLNARAMARRAQHKDARNYAEVLRAVRKEVSRACGSLAMNIYAISLSLCMGMPQLHPNMLCVQDGDLFLC